jgi:hypothetical protein
MRTPAIAIMTLVLPAATTPIFLVAMAPRVVSTPLTAPEASRRMPGDLAILDDVDAQREAARA